MVGITAHREKTDIIKDQWESDEEGIRHKQVLRSNRVIMPFSRRGVRENVVVRGKSLPGSLTMAVAVLKAYGRGGTVKGDLVTEAYVTEWRKNLSLFEKDHIPDNWCTVYINGDIAFSVTPHQEIDYLEGRAAGEALEEEILEEAEDRFRDRDSMTQISHDSQISLVLNTSDNNVKVSILERNVRQDGKFSFTMQNEGKKKKVVPALATAAYICEASSMLSLYGRLKHQLDRQDGQQLIETKKLMEVARELTIELRGRILSSNKVNKISFWPEPPKFISSTITSYQAGDDN